MQYRGVYKEGCSMKKVCASLFLIILLLAAVPRATADAVEHERWVGLG